MILPDRAFAIHFARVHLAECSRRRDSFVNRNFYWQLFATAQQSRRKAAAIQCEPVVRDLFEAMQ